MKAKNSLACFAALAFALTGFTFRHKQDEQPVRIIGWDVPDAAQSSGVGAALQQSGKLLAALRDSGWDFGRLSPKDHELGFLPDRKNAENPLYRMDRVASFNMYPCGLPGQQNLAPEHENIAFYTDLYVRLNRRYYKGDTSRSHPTGFFIVGYKDGHVEKVPVEQVRVYPRPAGDTHVVYAFSGMEGYDKALPNPLWRDAENIPTSHSKRDGRQH